MGAAQVNIMAIRDKTMRNIITINMHICNRNTSNISTINMHFISRIIITTNNKCICNIPMNSTMATMVSATQQQRNPRPPQYTKCLPRLQPPWLCSMPPT